jgi:hypothetical protein
LTYAGIVMPFSAQMWSKALLSFKNAAGASKLHIAVNSARLRVGKAIRSIAHLRLAGF